VTNFSYPTNFQLFLQVLKTRFNTVLPAFENILMIKLMLKLVKKIVVKTNNY